MEKAKEMNITVRFCLSPEYFDANYKQHLLKFLRDKYENKAFKDYGYIHKVIKIQKIIKEEIMSIIPNVFFMIQIKIVSYMPKVNEKMKLAIDKIFHHSIFLTENKIRVLVPFSMSSGFSIQKDFTSFYCLNEKTQQTYRKGDILEVTFTDIRFERDGFSCIGKIDS